jgi:hypothetical protein
LTGLGALAISEFLLRWWSRHPQAPALKIAMLGLGLRSGWILLALAATLESGRWQALPFTVALVAAYLTTQVIEGIRYQRFVASR